MPNFCKVNNLVSYHIVEAKDVVKCDELIPKQAIDGEQER